MEDEVAERPLIRHLRCLARLKEDQAELKAKLSAANKSYREHQIESLKLMEGGDIQNLKFATEGVGSYTAYQFSGTRSKIIDEAAFTEWANIEGNGSIEGFRMWSPGRINAAVRELQRDEYTALPEGLRVDNYNEVRLRKD